MNQKQQKSNQHCSFTPEFLFHKTNLKDRYYPKESSVVPNECKNEFPHVMTGNSFIETAMVQLNDCLKFGVLVLQVDNFKQKNEQFIENIATAVKVDVVKLIDMICKNENGIRGQLDGHTFGCFFPGKNQSACLQIGKNIQAKLATVRKETLTIGIAAFPTLDYQKNQIFENAYKALNHAAFFGPGSIVAFDAVSLNISGDQFYENGNIKGAIEEFKAGLQIDPLNVNIHNSLGVCYGVLGIFEKALIEFETAFQLDPNEIMVIYNLGLVNMLMKNKDKALKYFLEAESKDGACFEAAFQTGGLYLEMKKPEKAKEFFERAVKLKPSAAASRYLGQCYAAIGLTDEAVSAYKKAIKQNPNDADSLSALGYLFSIQGENLEIAELFCRQSLEYEPDNGLFRYRLGRIYLQQNRFEEALEEFKKAKRLGYDFTESIEKIEALCNRHTP
ncbi:MAG: tetratricopeptide repeat protein [Desulfobacterales bacterium]|nr:tetratricopeptide repeat protein [Desulfobacterales bacterium]